MVESSLETLLVTAVGRAPSLPIGLRTTEHTAVTVPSVTVTTDPKQLVAGVANPLTENDFEMRRRHLASPARLDNGDQSWQGRTG
jgi:hypothetical protein